MDPSGDAVEAKAAKPVKAVGFDVKGCASSPKAHKTEDKGDPSQQEEKGHQSQHQGKGDQSLHEGRAPDLVTPASSRKNSGVASFKENRSGEKACVEEGKPHELYMPLEPVFDGFSDLPPQSSLKVSKDYGEEPPHLPYGFDGFSESPGSCFTKVSSKKYSKGEHILEEFNVDSITRVDSPKRALPEHNGDENLNSVKRARDAFSIEKSTAVEGRKLDDHVYEEDVYPDMVASFKENPSGEKACVEERNPDDLDMPLEPVIGEAVALDSPIERRFASTIRTALSNLAKREASIKNRESSVSKREASMDKREASMDKREASMDKREGTPPNLKDGSSDASTTAKTTIVKETLVKFEKGVEIVQKADNTITLAEKILNIPKRSEEMAKIYTVNKTVASDFLMGQQQAISKKVKGIVGTMATVGVYNIAKEGLKDLLGIEGRADAEDAAAEAGVTQTRAGLSENKEPEAPEPKAPEPKVPEPEAVVREKK